MISISRRFQFCAGHRVYEHESKCYYPHGHNYVLNVYARAQQLDELGRVIDFGVLKHRIGDWIETNWDHTFLVFRQDLKLIAALEMLGGDNRSVILPVNPTAENLALLLLKEILPRVLAAPDIEIYQVELWETENCRAVATL